MTYNGSRATLQERRQAFAEQAQDYVDTTIARARSSVEQAADLVEKMQGPVKALAKAGIRLSELSQEYTEKLVTMQADLIGGTIADGAKRLRKVAKASNVRQLLRTQIELLPATRDRFTDEFRHAAEIVAEGGSDLRGFARETYGALTHPVKPARKTARKTTRAKTSARGKRSAKRKTASTRRAAARA